MNRERIAAYLTENMRKVELPYSCWPNSQWELSNATKTVLPALVRWAGLVVRPPKSWSRLYSKRGGKVCCMKTQGSGLILCPAYLPNTYVDCFYLKSWRCFYDVLRLILGPNVSFKNVPSWVWFFNSWMNERHLLAQPVSIKWKKSLPRKSKRYDHNIEVYNRFDQLASVVLVGCSVDSLLLSSGTIGSSLSGIGSVASVSLGSLACLSASALFVNSLISQCQASQKKIIETSCGYRGYKNKDC